MYSIFNVTIDSSDAEKKLGRLEQNITKLEKSGDKSLVKFGEHIKNFLKDLTSNKLDFTQATKEVELFQKIVQQLKDSNPKASSLLPILEIEGSLKDLSSIISTFGTNISEAKQENEKFDDSVNSVGKKLTGFGKIFTNLSRIFPRLGKSIKTLGSAFKVLTSVVNPVKLAFTILTTILAATYDSWKVYIEKLSDFIFEFKEYGLELWGTFKDWVTGASDTEKAQNKLNREVESYVRSTDRAVLKNKELFSTWKNEEKSIKDRIKALKELSKLTGKTEEELALTSDEDLVSHLYDLEFKKEKEKIDKEMRELATALVKREKVLSGISPDADMSNLKQSQKWAYSYYSSNRGKTSDEELNKMYNELLLKQQKKEELEEIERYRNLAEQAEKSKEVRKRNLELEKEYNKKTSLAKAEYYRELETAQIKHNEKMAKISQDEKEYTGDNIDFEKKRKEENTLYGREIQEITKKYQSYIKGINDSLTEITRTELENELSAIDEEYESAIEELIKKLGENHPEFNKLSNSLGVLRDSKKTKAKNENELEELEIRQDIEIKGLEAIYEREQKIAELRGDEKLSYQSTQGFINKQIELEQQKLSVLRRQKAEYDSMGNNQMSESIQKQINTSELTLAQKNVEKFDNSLAELGKTIGKDLDFTTLDNGFKLLKQKFDDLRGHTEKYNELMLEYNNSTNEEERERLKGEMDQVQAQKSVLEKDILKNGLNQGANALANGIAFAGEKMKELAEATGDVKLGEMADQVSAMGNVLQSAAQGLASGGWIGAAVGAFQSIVTQIVDGIISAKAEMKELEDNANDFEDSLRESSMLFDPSQNESIFGENKMAKMRDVLKASQDFANEYKSTIEEIESAGFQGNKTRRNFGLAFLLDPDALRQQIYLQEKSTKEYQTYLEGLRKGYDGLENMLIKTKERNGFLNFIGIQDEYTSLKDLAPELWDEKGEFNVKNAEIFLETNTQISEEQRKQLMLIVEQKKQSEEYMEQLESMLTETFGGISSAMSDALISSIRNGEDALESLAEAGKGVINSLEQQMVSSIFNTYMSSYEDSLKKIIEGGGNENEMADLFYDMFKGMNKTVKVATKAVEEFERTALENGFDLAKATETAQEALKGGISAMTEDTASELNGNFMGLKLSAMEISQKTSDILSYSQQNNSLIRSALTALNQVVVNTDYCRHLEEINNTLDSIKRQGVKVL